jgi:glycerol uptake facilitator protein
VAENDAEGRGDRDEAVDDGGGVEERLVEVDITVREVPDERGVPAYAAEFIGTFLLVFFICTVVTVSAGLQGADFAGFRAADFLLIGLLHFLVLSMLIYTLGGTSGAHFNPAVTATLAALRRIAPVDAVIYVLLQLSGAVAGALVCKALLSDEVGVVDNGAPAVNTALITSFGGFTAEAIGTFVLMWAIMGVAVNPRGHAEWAGLVIGGTLGFAVFTFGPLTGGSFNPARWFGPALVDAQWETAWAYILGPIVGALAAGFAYKAIVLDPAGRIGERPIDKLP